MVGRRFNDNASRGYSHLIVREEISPGKYRVEWFDKDGNSRGTNDTWCTDSLLNWGGVILDESWDVERLLKEYGL